VQVNRIKGTEENTDIYTREPADPEVREIE